MHRHLRSILIAASLTKLMSPGGLYAATKYWDGGVVNGGNPAADANGGAGTWNNTLTNWDSAATGTTSVAWANNDNAIFGGTAGIITVSGALGVSDMTFNTTGYSLTGGTLTLGGTTPTLTTGTGITTSISSTLAGTTTWTKAGAGTLILSGTNTYTGNLAVSAGVLNIQNGSALGSAAGDTTVSSGAALELESVAGIAVGAEALSLAGTGISNGGALRNISGNNSFAGAITLANSPLTHRINSDADTLTLSGSISETGNALKTLIFGGEGNILVSGSITATGGDLAITKDGTGTLTLTGTNTNDGATTISAGTLALGNGGTTGTLGAGAITNNGVLAVNRSNAITLANTISGTGALIKSGAGTLTLSGNNTYTGATTISAGTINAQNAGALGTSGGVTVASGAALEIQGGIALAAQNLALAGTGVASAGALRNVSGTNSFAGAITLSGGSTEIQSDAGTLTLSGGISGSAQNLAVDGAGAVTISGTIGTASGTLTKTGAGTLTLSGNNTYTGGTTLAAGTIAFASGGLGTTGAITMNGGALQWNGANTDDVSARITMVSGKAATFDTNGNAVTFSSAIGGGTTGALIKTGAGTLTLSGNNTYTGGTTVSAGTLSFASGGLGAVGAITMNGGSLQWNGANTDDISGRLALIAAKTATLDTNGNDITFASAIGGGTTGALTKTGVGTLTLSVNNTYTGATTVSAGTLNIRTATALGTTAGGVTVASGAALEIQGGVAVGAEALSLNGTGVAGNGALRSVSGTNSYAGAITLAGATEIHSDAGALTLSGGIAGTNTNLSFDGAGDTVVSGTINTGTSTLTKSGTGTLTLSGTISGTATAIAVREGVTILDYSSNATNRFGAVLNFAGGAVSIAGGAVTDAGTSASVTRGASTLQRVSGTSSLGLNALTRTAGATLNITQAGLASTDTVSTNGIIGGWLTLAGNDFINNTDNTDGALGTAATYVNNTWAAANNTTVTANASPTSGSTTNSLRFGNAGAFTVTLAGTNTITSGGILVTAAVGANATAITGGTLRGANTADLIVHQYNTAEKFTINSVIANNTGATALTKSGPGTLVLTGANTYTGKTFLNTGTLEVTALANGGLSSAIGASAKAAANLVIFGGSTFAYTGSAAASTDRSFTLSNLATATVAANGTGAGTLSFTDTAAVAFDTANQVRSLTLSGTNTGDNTFALRLTDNGTATVSLTKAGAGKWILTGANTYTGVTTVAAGTLEVASLGNGGATSGFGSSSNAASNLVITGGGTLAYVGASNTSTDRSFSVTGNNTEATLANNGAGTVDFSNASGTVAYDTPNQARTIALAGTNTGDNVFRLKITDNTGAPVTLKKLGAGKWTMTGINTFSGATTVSGGTLLVNGSNASSAVTVESGAVFGGSGTVGAVTLKSGATLSPGAAGDGSLGTLNAGALVWNGGGTLKFDLGASGTSDKIALSGILSKGTPGGYLFDFNNTGSVGAYTLVTGSSIAGFTAADFSFSNLGAGLTGNFVVNPGSVVITVTVIPETGFTVGAGAIAALLAVRRRKKK